MKKYILILLFVFFINYTNGAVVNLSICNDTIRTDHNIYELNTSISSTGNCTRIFGVNNTLDCKGYTINYSLDGLPLRYGIFTNNSNNTIKNCNILVTNNTGLVNRYGIYVLSARAVNTKIYNNTFYGNATALYLITTTNYFDIQNNTFNSSRGSGLVIQQANHGFVFNNILISNSTSSTGYGTFLYMITNTTFLNNNITHNNAYYSLSLSRTTTSNIINNSILCTGTSANCIGLLLTEANYNNLISNTVNCSSTTTGQSYYITTSYHNNLINNFGYSRANQGLYLLETSNNTINNNSFYSVSSYACLISTTNYSIINNTKCINSCTGISCVGIFFSTLSRHNIITSSNISSNTAGVKFDGMNILNNSFKDCIQLTGGISDINASKTANGTNTFINCSYNKTKEHIYNRSFFLERKWYIQVLATSNNGNLGYINISGTNRTNQIKQFSVLTNQNGYSERLEVIDYISNGTTNYWSPWNITATNNSYLPLQTNLLSQSLNVSLGNNLTIGFLFNITSGGTGQGETVYITTDLRCIKPPFGELMSDRLTKKDYCKCIPNKLTRNC